MIKITALDGTALNFDDDTIACITGPYPGDPPNRSYVTGPAADTVPTDEAAASIVARLHPKTPLAELTRPDLSPIWIKGAAVAYIRAPEPGETPPGETVGAIVLIGSKHQAVTQDVATASALINAHGGTC